MNVSRCRAEYDHGISRTGLLAAETFQSDVALMYCHGNFRAASLSAAAAYSMLAFTLWKRRQRYTAGLGVLVEGG